MKSSGGIGLRDVRKHHPGQPMPTLDVPALDLGAGELTTLLGPSGCGKTTLLRVIGGLEPAEGQVLIDGEDVSARPAAEREVCHVFQSYALFPHLDVLGNVAFGLRALPRDQAQAQARAALSALGLEGLESRRPLELSGGQQQRVAVARALVMRPKVLLFDEPLSNLDAHLRRQVREDIRALQQSLGITVVYVTHDAAEALAVSDRVVVMQAGRVVQSGTPRELYERPLNAFVAGFMSDATLLEARVDHAGSLCIGPLRVEGRSTAPPGTVLRLAVRPHAWRVHPPSHPGLGAVVQRAAYLGGVQELQVLTDLGEFVVHCNAGSVLYRAGAPVCLTLGVRGLAAIGSAFSLLS